MAGSVRFTYSSTVLVMPAATKAAFQIASISNRGLKVERVRISGQSVNGLDAPVEWRFYYQTAVAATGTAAILTNLDQGAGAATVQSTGLYFITAEPTGTTVLWNGFISPLGSHEIIFPPGRELFIPGGKWLGITAVNAADVNNWIIQADFME